MFPQRTYHTLIIQYFDAPSKWDFVIIIIEIFDCLSKLTVSSFLTLNDQSPPSMLSISSLQVLQCPPCKRIATDHTSEICMFSCFMHISDQCIRFAIIKGPPTLQISYPTHAPSPYRSHTQHTPPSPYVQAHTQHTPPHLRGPIPTTRPLHLTGLIPSTFPLTIQASSSRSS